MVVTMVVNIIQSDPSICSENLDKHGAICDNWYTEYMVANIGSTEKAKSHNKNAGV